jgi:hypothetical protein
MSKNGKKLTERNRLGQFLPNNTAGITSSQRARELQKLSARKRVENNKKRMREALCLAFAESNEWDALKKMYLKLCLDALEGSTSAAMFIFKTMRYVED